MISQKNIGILGGGQLGKMLCEAASPWHLNMHILDANKAMPASSCCSSFTEGSFKNYDDVLRFGKNMDVITIEIEHVNLDALIELEKMGKEVHPKPGALLKIVDKGLQKEFYKKHGIPTSSFQLLGSASEINTAINKGSITFPFIQKTRKEGYDGRGVQLIASADEKSRIMDVPSLIEELIDIDKELAVISARNKKGQIESFEPVEMEFKEGANLLDLLRSPSDISEEIKRELIAISEEIIDKMDIVGVLAVEFFLDKKGRIYVNEIAPRPHNSGHQSIENNIVSQYEQHLRAILNLPLIQPKTLSPAIMINILGEEGYEGNAQIEGIEEVLELPGVYPHWYGKKITKPFRKMGHITILDDGEAIDKVRKIRKQFKVKAK